MIFINTLLRIAIVTKLAMSILRKVFLRAAACNLGYMNKTLFALFVFDYLILTFFLKSRGQRKIPDISRKLDFLSFVSMVTAKDSGALLFPIGYRQIA